MPVIIVGAGIGGLTTALALARRGVPSVVLERAERMEEVGAGLQLSPNACRVLFDLGVETQVRRIGFAPDSVSVRSAGNNQVLLENRLGAFAEHRWRAPYLQVRRSALHAVLEAAVRASEHADMRLGMQVTGLEQRVDGAGVILANGQRVDGFVVIGCDGLNSILRAALWGRTPARFTGQTAWRGLARSQHLPLALRTEASVWAGPQRHFVHYPVGEGWVNMVAVTEADACRGEGWTEDGERGALAKAFAGWPEPVRTIIGAVQTPWRSALFDRPPLAHWSKGRATLLGDAAHPMLPFLAQGAAMAIEDAAVLADCLADAVDIPAALLAYEASRRPRTAKVQAWASRNATLFHLPDSLLKAAFGAASVADRLASRPGEGRFDWLYGYRAVENDLL